MATPIKKGVVDTTPISKHIATYDEVVAQQNGYFGNIEGTIRKSSRPDSVATVGGDIEPPELEKINKSASPRIRMGRGVDPHKVVENDWNEYKVYMSRNKF